MYSCYAFEFLWIFLPQIWHPYRRCESKIAKYFVCRRFLLTKCLIIASRPVALFNLVLSNSMWFLNFRFSSRVIPRYFVWVNGWIFWPLIQKFRFLVMTLCFDRNSISSVLSALREILLVLSQWIMFFRSKLTLLFMSFMDLLAYNKLASSAKWCMSEYVTMLCKSLMYIRKSKDPSTEPWGAPMFMGRVSDHC